MTAWLVAAVDRLLPLRRVVVVVVALVTVGAAVATQTLAPPPVSGPRPRPRSATSRTPARETATSSVRQHLRLPVSRAGLVRARRTAQRCLAGYLKFAYGRTRALAATVTPGLRRELAGALVTPVGRRQYPRVVSLRVVGTTPGFVVATAVVEDGGVIDYQLRFTLQARGGRWLVSGVDGG